MTSSLTHSSNIYFTPTISYLCCMARSKQCGQVPWFMMLTLLWGGRERQNMNEWMSEWMNEWMGEWVNKWMSEWINECVNGWMSEWMDEWVSEWINEWMDEWVIDEWMNELMDEWANELVEWMHEWMNEWILSTWWKCCAQNEMKEHGTSSFGVYRREHLTENSPGRSHLNSDLRDKRE